jgi:hypothetical protein
MAQPLPLPRNPLQLRPILMPSANNEGCVVKNFEKSCILVGNKIKGLNFKERLNPTARTGRWKEKSRNSCNRASPRSPTPYTRYEKGTSFPTDCERLEDWKSCESATRRWRDREHLEMLSRRRNPHRAADWVFYGATQGKGGVFLQRCARERWSRPWLREGFVDTDTGRDACPANIDWVQNSPDSNLRGGVIQQNSLFSAETKKKKSSQYNNAFILFYSPKNSITVRSNL